MGGTWEFDLVNGGSVLVHFECSLKVRYHRTISAVTSVKIISIHRVLQGPLNQCLVGMKRGTDITQDLE